MNDNKDPFDLGFMDNYYDNLMQEKMNSQVDPFATNDSRFRLDSILGNNMVDQDRDMANAFIDAYYMEEYDEMEKEFLSKLMEPKTEEKPKHDYKNYKHIREFKKAVKE